MRIAEAANLCSTSSACSNSQWTTGRGAERGLVSRLWLASDSASLASELLQQRTPRQTYSLVVRAGLGTRLNRVLGSPRVGASTSGSSEELGFRRHKGSGLCGRWADPSTGRQVARKLDWRAQALPPFLAAELPEAGPVRDVIFAALGATAALVLSAAVAWAWHREELRLRAAAMERGSASLPESSSTASQKESVEWVNMVVQKIWRIYRRSLELWLVGLLQPAIDKLPKPEYVTRVEIAEFSLNFEPITLRNVQRRASRRSNDLQYHIGLRYTGGARCLLVLHMNRSGINTSIPVGVHDLDVDGELWVKLRLTPRKPYVGTLSIAFVRLPTIKLVLAPFRIVNLFAVPFLSSFLSKLLTVDLPRLIVLPRHITFDFLPSGEDANLVGGAPVGSGSVVDLLSAETSGPLAANSEPNEKFVGELTVTLCEARNLATWNLSGWSNPYCVLSVGDRKLDSKKNRETSHPSGSRDPVWNQDFQFWVEDPLRQKLTVHIRDSSVTLRPNIGFVQVPIWQLEDCVPVSLWSPLLQEGPFGVKPVPGELRLLLTYKSYVDKQEPELRNVTPPVPYYIKVFSEEGESDDSEKTGRGVESGSDSDGTQVLTLTPEVVEGGGGTGAGGTSGGGEGYGMEDESEPHAVAGSAGGSNGRMTAGAVGGSEPEPGRSVHGVGDEAAFFSLNGSVAPATVVERANGDGESKEEKNWTGAVVEKTVGVSLGAGKWVAETAVGLWDKVARRDGDKGASGSSDSRRGNQVSGETGGDAEPHRQLREAGSVEPRAEAEGGLGEKVGSVLAKVWSIIPKPGVQVQVESRPSDAEQPIKEEAAERIANQLEDYWTEGGYGLGRRFDGGGASTRLEEDSGQGAKEWWDETMDLEDGIRSAGFDEEVDGLLRSVGGNPIRLELVPWKATEPGRGGREEDGTPGGRNGLAKERDETYEPASVNGRAYPNGSINGNVTPVPSGPNGHAHAQDIRLLEGAKQVNGHATAAVNGSGMLASDEGARGSSGLALVQDRRVPPSDEHRQVSNEGDVRDDGLPAGDPSVEDEVRVQVARRGALNKAIMELVDFFDKRR